MKFRKQQLKHGGDRSCKVEKIPLQFVLFMVWHDSMRLGKTTEEEVGMWAETEI